MPVQPTARRLTVHHPDIQPGDVWRLRVTSPDRAGRLLDGDGPREALLSNTGPNTRLQIVCAAAGRLNFTVEDAAGAVLSEAQVVCMAEAALPPACGGPDRDPISGEPSSGDPDPSGWDAGLALDAGSPPADAGLAEPDALPDMAALPSLSLRVLTPGPVELSWPDTPVDGVPSSTELTVRVTRDGEPVQGARVGLPPGSPPGPFQVDSVWPTGPDGQTRVRLEPRPYRGEGLLRLQARLDDGAWSDRSPALRVRTVSAPVTRLALSCEDAVLPALLGDGPEGYHLAEDVFQLCEVSAFDNGGGTLEGATVSLHAEAGQVPARVVTGESGSARFRWQAAGRGPYAPFDRRAPEHGRVTLMAATPGMEAFQNRDEDPGAYSITGDSRDLEQDRGEPFVDLNGDGERTRGLPPRQRGGAPVDEPYLDLDGDLRYDGPDGAWNPEVLVWDALQVTWTGPPSEDSLIRTTRPRCDDGERYQIDGGGHAPPQAPFELRVTDVNGLCPHGTAEIEVFGNGQVNGPERFDLSQACSGQTPRTVAFTVVFSILEPIGWVRITLRSETEGVPPIVREFRFCNPRR